MSVNVKFIDDTLTDLVFEQADGVDITPGGAIRVYRRGVSAPDVQVGAVAASLWSYYRVSDVEIESPYPRTEGEVTLLGPGVSLSQDGSSISYDGREFQLVVPPSEETPETSETSPPETAPGGSAEVDPVTEETQ